MPQVLGVVAVVAGLAFVQWRRRWSRLRRPDNAPLGRAEPPGPDPADR